MTRAAALALLCLVLCGGCDEPKPAAPHHSPHVPSPPRSPSAPPDSAGSRAESPPPNGSASKSPTSASQNLVAVQDPIPSCTGERRRLYLYSWTQPRVSAQYGPPTKKESYRVVERQGEFYSAIEEIYPTTEPRNLDVPIEEWTWVQGDCRLTVWFHRPDGDWKALGDLVWHYADEF